MYAAIMRHANCLQQFVLLHDSCWYTCSARTRMKGNAVQSAICKQSPSHTAFEAKLPFNQNCAHRTETEQKQKQNLYTAHKHTCLLSMLASSAPPSEPKVLSARSSDVKLPAAAAGDSDSALATATEPSRPARVPENLRSVRCGQCGNISARACTVCVHV
jgi:hypothetical protein